MVYIELVEILATASGRLVWKQMEIFLVQGKRASRDRLVLHLRGLSTRHKMQKLFRQSCLITLQWKHFRAYGDRKIMMRVVTLDITNKQGFSKNDLHACITQLRCAEIDILCCQGIWHAMDEKEDATRILMESLQMPYSCFTVNHHQKKGCKGKSNDASGLAILTGSGMWMLNSGSFPFINESDGTKQTALFALVRKNGTSILILNLQLCGSKQSRLRQLRTIFSHPMLKERYGAVVLCGNRQTGLSAKEVQAITDNTKYSSYRNQASSVASPGEGILCMLVAREHPVAAVTICSTGTWEEEIVPCNQTFCDRQTSLSLDFAMDRIPQKHSTSVYLPLSFEEQWVGLRDRFPAVAA